MHRATFERVRKVIADLKACSRSRNLDLGKHIHEAAVQYGDDSNPHVAGMLINMYAKCGSMNGARKVFDSINRPDVVCWTSLILGYADNGEGEVGLDLFSRMRFEGCEPDDRTFVAVIMACSSDLVEDAESVETGKVLHLLACKSGCDSNNYVQGSLVNMYSKFERMVEARGVFELVKHPDVVSWTALIAGYVSYGESQTALSLFERMRDEGCLPNARTFVAAINACTDLASKAEGNDKLASKAKAKELHSLVTKSGCDSDAYVQCALISLYVKFGDIEQVGRIFSSTSNPDVVHWTALISGYAENGQGDVALEFFIRMRHEGCAPNPRTFSAALKACLELSLEEEGVIKLESRQRGKVLHLLCVRDGCISDIYVQAVLVDMYSKCGTMEDARNVFDSVKDPNVVCWNSLLQGYAEHGDGEIVLDLFPRLRQDCAPNARSFVAAIKACASLTEKKDCDYSRKGQKLHVLACECGLVVSDQFLQGSLVDMYAKYGDMEEARRVFDIIRNPDAVSWTSLILGYTEKGESDTALDLFSRMKYKGCTLDVGTYVAAFKACVMSGSLEIGKKIHAEIRGRAFEHDLTLTTCLVNFYAKCGHIYQAQQVFDSCDTSNLVIWNSLMAGYSRSGDTKTVFDLFDRMLSRSIKPDCITMKCILSACNHAGLVEIGNDYFQAMFTKYGIKPDVEHYNCMIDMFGRSNKLDEAMVFLRRMPSFVNSVTWMTILGACKKLDNGHLGRLAFESLTSLDNENARAYVDMANIQTICI